jgi:DDE_Tnp_1-associated
VPVQSVMPGRPLATMDDLPEVLPVMLPVSRQIPALLGAEPVVLPAHMPSGLPDHAARQLAAALSGQRPGPRGGRAAGVSTPGPAVVLTLGQDTELTLDTTECARLHGFLDAVPDRRTRRGRRYRLSYLLAVAVAAMMADDIDLARIGEWAATAPTGLLTALGAFVDRHGRVARPDTATITRALAAAGEDLDRALCAWIGAIRRAQHPAPEGVPLYRCLHVDGKAQKGAACGGRAPMLLAARADDGTVPAQVAISAKTNEIPMFAPLLDRITDLTGTVVTADQLHTQRGHATYHRGS